jgi:hypothetical protein
LDTSAEKNMRAVTVLRSGCNKFTSVLRSLHRSTEFAGGDCERWVRCGMPSSDNCIFKAEQIARGDWQMKRLARALSLASGWATPLNRPKLRSSMDPEIW